MKRKKTTADQSQSLVHAASDDLIEELISVAWSDVVALRISLGLRPHQTTDTAKRPPQITTGEFKSAITSLMIAEAEFIACMTAFSWSVPLPVASTKAAPIEPRKRTRKVQDKQPSGDVREWCADGNFRQIESLREQIGLRQFQRAEEAE
jgi:hypothetical protein